MLRAAGLWWFCGKCHPSSRISPVIYAGCWVCQVGPPPQQQCKIATIGRYSDAMCTLFATVSMLVGTWALRKERKVIVMAEAGKNQRDEYWLGTSDAGSEVEIH